MKKVIYRILFVVLAGLVSFSCAEKHDTDTSEFYNGAFDRWMAKYHPNAVKQEGNYAGLYVNWFNQNPDAMPPRNGYWLKLDYTGRDQDGNIFVTRDEDIAKQMGFFMKNERIRYLPEIVQYEPSSLTADYPVGYILALSLMKEGDSLRVYMPPGMGYSNYSYYTGNTGFTYSYTKHYGFSSSGVSVPTSLGLIFDIKIAEIIKDINLYENEQVLRFAADSLGITNPTDTLTAGAYMKKLVVNEAGDSVKTESTAHVYYVGRYLDGFVFDTNIDSVAKANGMTEGREVLKVDMSSNSTVKGFSETLMKMLSGEHARVVFVSDLGYGVEGATKSISTGSTSTVTATTIPGYTPLEFEIYVEAVEYPEEEDDEE